MDAVVTFNEIHYHPASSRKQEFIELHNQMAIRVDLSGWRLSGGVDFTFPEGTVLEPGSYELVRGSIFSGQLSNSGETLSLRDRNDRLMDWLAYQDNAPWPVGSDGSGMSLAKLRPSLASGEALIWAPSRKSDGSPGRANNAVATGGDLWLSEVGPGFVEFQNLGTTSLSLADYTISTSAKEPVSLEGSLEPGVLNTRQDDAIMAGEALFLKDAAGHLLDAVRVETWPQARRSNDARWHRVGAATSNAPNSVVLHEDVVIHEIMYHFPPLYDQPGTLDNEFTERDEERVELYNRGAIDMDLSGWELDQGIRYAFPDGTILSAGAFLLVARDAESLASKYPDILVAGDFNGTLSNRQDHLVLRDDQGNIADEVRYADSGRWPSEADGEGSTLQLLDPWADNALPESWIASDESSKSEWVDIIYEGRASQPMRSNNPDNYHEFLMGLLDAGEALIDNVRVIEDPQGAAIDLMRNGTFDKTNIFSGTLNDWRLLGTHAHSHTQLIEGNPALRLVADGAIEHTYNNTYNNASSTFLTGHRLEDTLTYAISLRAKWLSGSPQLNTRLYLNRLAKTYLLPIPDQLGSPGTGTPINMGPSLSALDIQPVSPKANESISITITASDAQGIDSLTLHYRTPNVSWQSTTMIGSQNRYEGDIPGHPLGTVIQWHIEARDLTGTSSFFPAKGPDSRALLRVSTSLADEARHTVRLILWPDEHAAMLRPEHAVSNGRVGGTLIVNDQDYHHDVAVRLRSSPFGRRGDRAGYNISLGKDQPFRGVHDYIAIDRGSVMPNGNSNGFFEVKSGAGVNELIVNQIAQRARGIPTNHEDVIFIETPDTEDSSVAQLRMARYGPRYLDGQFENGAAGATHKLELIYYPTATMNGRPDGLKGPYNAVLGNDIQDMRDDKEAYRFNYLPTNNRDSDDFTGIIRLADAFSTRTDSLRREKVPEAIDVDQWMRTFAFQSLIGVADTYNMGLEHNLVLYTRPSDQRVLAMPWDLDHAFFYTPTADLLGRGGTNFARVINLPEYTRLFYGHLDDIIPRAFNTQDMAPWIAHLNDVTGNQYDERILNYIDRRASHVRAKLQNVVSRRFEITTNRGEPITTDMPSITLEGHGWVNVRNIRNEITGTLLPLTWTDLNVWQSDISLALGVNEIILQAVDFQGNDIGSIFMPGSDRITITHTGDHEAASSKNLRISEIHYHPAADSTVSEFIELQNIGSATGDLTGIRFTRGLEWELTAPHLLERGEVILLVPMYSAIDPTLPFLGMYQDSALSNGGETLRLEDRIGGLIHELQHEDSLPWPEEADSRGYSLVARGGSANDPRAWRASIKPGGSPGLPYPTSSFDGTSLLHCAFGARMPLELSENESTLTMRFRTLADDFVWTLQGSLDLISWEEVNAEISNRQQDHDTSILTWTRSSVFFYYRLALSEAPSKP